MKKFIAAVSGGPDSMALLNKYKDQIIAVCSVDYNKRENSWLDNKIVEEFCTHHNINYHLLTVSDDIYMKYSDNNFQNMARKIRYDFFLKVANDYRIFDILIAHNKNDWLETAYMQYNKKSKSLYYGIKKYSNYKNLNIYRPLIKIKKENLKQYCNKNNVKYALDYTNDLDIYERNKIRKIINQWSFIQYFSFLSKIHFYNIKKYSLYKKNIFLFNEWKKDDFSCSFFKKQSIEMQYYLMYEFLSLNNETNNSTKKINNIIEFINKTQNKKYRIENNGFISIKNDRIIIIRGK